jgi:hypothetical protein
MIPFARACAVMLSRRAGAAPARKGRARIANTAPRVASSPAPKHMS